MTIFITSDLHFCHNKDFLYAPRGFKSIEAHDAQVVTLWNSVVSEEDTVYVLGDLVLTNTPKGIEYIKQLKGNIKVILGNHDTDTKIELYKQLPNVEVLGYGARLTYKKYHFFLTHYPTLVGNYDDKESLHGKTINLCGHTHTQNKWIDWDKGTIYHCELDAHMNFPISLDYIISDLKNRKIFGIL